MNDISDEQLDRALFALPLEEPPEDLRASILAGTIYRPAFPVKPWEVGVMSAALAVLVWVVTLIAAGGLQDAGTTFGAIGHFVLSVASQPQMLVAIAVGCAAVAWISQINFIPAPSAKMVSRR